MEMFVIKKRRKMEDVEVLEQQIDLASRSNKA